MSDRESHPGAPGEPEESFTHRGSVVVAAPPHEVWAMVADVTRHGEWSPVVTGCSWDDADPQDVVDLEDEADREPGGGAGRRAPAVGDRFTGRNSADGRTWETGSVIVAAEPGVEIAWQVNEDWVRWGFLTQPHGQDGSSTLLTETWEFLPAGLAGFRARDGGEAAIAHRARQSREGIPVTLAAIRAIAGSTPG